MRVELRLDPGCRETVVTVTAPARTAEVEELLRRLAPLEPIPGWQGDTASPLEPAEILRFYGESKEVLAQTGEGVYTVHLRLYELEDRLKGLGFARISHSEIVNLRKITALDLSLTGTIRLTLAGGTVCYTSRRYVKKIKEAVGL